MAAEKDPSLERYKALAAHELELNRATADFERAALQPLLLLNGGAPVAVLALLGAVSADSAIQLGISQVRFGLVLWCIGLISATVAMWFGYTSQRAFSKAARLDREFAEANLQYAGEGARQLESDNASELRSVAKKQQRLWHGIAGLSLLCFIGGVLATATGLRQGMLRQGPPPPSGDIADALIRLTQALESAATPAPDLLPFTGLAIAGMVVGLLLARPSYPPVVRVIGALTVPASLIAGGASLFKISEVKVPLQVQVGGASSASSGVEFVRPVGPFVTGKTNILEPEAMSSGGAVADLVEALKARAKGRELAHLLLVGSADKFELSPRLLNRYGSNTGLARARADWVAEQARLAWKGEAYESLALTVGPGRHGTELSAKETGADRSVTVYAAWRERGILRDLFRISGPASGKSEGPKGGAAGSEGGPGGGFSSGKGGGLR